MRLESNSSNGGILPSYVQELAHRRAYKIIHELNQTLSPQERERIQTEVDDLLEEILDVLADAPDVRQSRAVSLLSEARKALDGEPAGPDLITAKRKISQANQIAKRWESEKRQANSIFWVGLITSVTIFAAAAIYLATQDWASSKAVIPLLDVPPSVALWGGVGGLAAVIRSLMNPDRAPSAFSQVRILLVTRPVFGLFAGCVVYLLIVSGLTAFAYTTQVTTEQGEANRALLWAMAFAGGFYAPLLEKLLYRASSEASDLGSSVS